MLDSIFYQLLEDGFIYDTDSNGKNMSYGEYLAIQNYFIELIEERIEECVDFLEVVDFIEKEVKGCIDDVKLFVNLEDFEDFYFYLDDYNKEITAYNVPKIIENKFNDFISYYDNYKIYT